LRRALNSEADYAREGVRAWVGTGPDRKFLDTHPNRENAMRAVSAGDAVRRRLDEPVKRARVCPDDRPLARRR
jgi:hypothetical protein